MNSVTGRVPGGLTEFHALTAARWPDFVELFGARGACAGCWCMYWRLSAREFEHNKHAGNRRRMRALVSAGSTPGILGYADCRPVGWCAVAPRSEYIRLGGSRVLAPVDELPVWSVGCLFVGRMHRKQGVAVALVKAAVDFARRRGARMIEAYPVEPKTGRDIPAAFAWTGIPSLFAAAGLVEVARRSPTRPIMRKTLERN